MSMFAGYALAQHGPTCCDLMGKALLVNRGDGRPKGLRRRLVIREGGLQAILVLYAIGREDALVEFCPFCGARQNAAAPNATPVG